MVYVSNWCGRLLENVIFNFKSWLMLRGDGKVIVWVNIGVIIFPIVIVIIFITIVNMILLLLIPYIHQLLINYIIFLVNIIIRINLFLLYFL